MSNILVRALAVIGALTVFWLLMVAAIATYDAVDDGSMMDGMSDMMGGMGDMQSMRRA